MNRRNLFYTVILSVVILEILSLSTTDSPWPWGVLQGQSIGLRILGWYFVVQAGFALLGMLVLARVVPDKECPICQRDLKVFLTVYGGLIACPRCRTFFHKNCWKSKGGKCPICYPESDDSSTIRLDFGHLGRGPNWPYDER